MRQMMKTGLGIAVVCFVMLLNTYTASANEDITIPPGTTQQNFKDFTEQMGLAISYMPLAPAAPLGLLGFDAGIEVTAANIDHSVLDKFTTNNDFSDSDYVLFPKLHAQVGLPLNLDVGLVYTKVPDSNVSMIGGELKWAFIGGGVAMPALALRGSYTKLLGVSDIDLNTYGLDLSISKGFAFLTPYAGIGMVWLTSRPHSSSVALQSEQTSQVKGYGGLRISILHFISMVAEADFSAIQAYTFRLNVSF